MKAISPTATTRMIVAGGAALALVFVFFRGGNPPPTMPTPAPPTEEVPPTEATALPLEIWFESSPTDASRAADLRCQISVGTTNTQVSGSDRQAFLFAVEEQIDRWLGSDVDTAPGIWVYMRPYPGEGVFEQVQDLARRKGVTVTRIDSPRPGGEAL